VGAGGVKSFPQLKYREGFLAGFMMATFLLLVFTVWSDRTVIDNIKENFFGYFTLAGSLSAAYFAVKGISLQVEHLQESEDLRKESLLIAAKAGLSLTLSDLREVCRQAILFTLNTDRHANGAIATAQKLVMSEASLLALKECIEYADPNDGSRLANIIRHFQIATSRTIGSYQEPDVGKLPYTDTFDWATIQLLLDDCFAFARGQSEHIPARITNGTLYTALYSIDSIVIDDYDGLVEEIHRRSNFSSLEIITKQGWG
jgi:hypothetical protein